MSKDSHNHTASKPNPALLPNEHSETDHYPSDREILAAMVSELCAECVRVSGEHTGYQVYFYWTPGADSIRVHAGPWGGKDLHSVIREHVFLDWGAPNGALSRLIARVSALGAES